jgi:molybdopterin molybdotransferase
MLASQLIEVIDLGRHPDDARILCLCRRAARADVIISSGITGSDANHVADAITAAGGVGRRFRMSIKPGKPIPIGRIRGTAVLGLSGAPAERSLDRFFGY